MNRREAREQAFCLVFERSFRDETLEEILEAAQMARDWEISDYAERVFYGVVQQEQQIDREIEANCISWKKDRLSHVTLSVLRVALYEMLFDKDIPISVSINEAVELAKTYGTKDDASFVNGVLGATAKKLESAHEQP